jgi:hypothetical protein
MRGSAQTRAKHGAYPGTLEALDSACGANSQRVDSIRAAPLIADGDLRHFQNLLSKSISSCHYSSGKSPGRLRFSPARNSRLALPVHVATSLAGNGVPASRPLARTVDG